MELTIAYKSKRKTRTNDTIDNSSQESIENLSEFYLREQIKWNELLCEAQMSESVENNLRLNLSEAVSYALVIFFVPPTSREQRVLNLSKILYHF